MNSPNERVVGADEMRWTNLTSFDLVVLKMAIHGIVVAGIASNSLFAHVLFLYYEEILKL